MALQIRRGTDAQRQTIAFKSGELIYTTDLKDMWVGDGVTNGGTQLSPVKSVNGSTGTVVLTTDQVTQGSTNKYYSTNQAKIDSGAALVAGNGGNTGITFSYNSGTNVINAIVTNSGGLSSLSGDSSPSLGGNLLLNSRNIVGTGNINFTGNLTATGTVTATTGLGANLPLNSFSITGSGSIAYSSSTPYPLLVTSITDGSPGTTWMTVQASKGTTDIPTTTAAGDSLSGYQVRGYTGSTYKFAGGFYATWSSGSTLADNQPASVLTFVCGAGGSSAQTMTLDNTGTFTVPNIKYTGLRLTSANFITVGSTATYALSTTQHKNILLVGSSGLTATLTLPPSPLDGQILLIAVHTNNTTLAMTAGPTVSGPFAGAVTAPTTFEYVYRASNTTWYRIQ
jgi:hypothetical protein